MANISLKLSKDKIDSIKNTFKDDIKASPNEYIDTFINRDNLTISIYKSGKVVFQGNDALYYGSAFIDKKISRQAGSDEVGTGDFFGPVCVCACIVEEEQFPLLEKLGVNDSKEIDDHKIKEIAPILIKELKHSLLILENKQYNTVHEHYNLNAIKAKLHNKAYLNMLKKGYQIPKACYVDQFAPENLYYSYLKDGKEVLALIDKLHKEGKTIIMVSHYVEECVKCDRVLLINNGRQIIFDRPRNVFCP